MSFVDELTIYARAGRGGDGAVRWRSEKFREYGGPAGGNGGRGGDVYIYAIRDASLLSHYRHQKEFIAQNGEPGRSLSQHGKNGEDLMIKLPIGSFVKNLTTGEEYELTYEDQQIKILSGGMFGYGNEHFKSSTNINPTMSTPGKPGEEADLYIELRLVADVGLIGLPNAGKSSLLNAITNTNVKVGNFAFTTLEPNLGSLYGVIIADIPGLIEGASEGKGLGHTFLRHVQKTKILIHCIAADSADPMSDYHTVRAELTNYGRDLSLKQEIVLITKNDTVESDHVESLKKQFKKKYELDCFDVSIYDDSSLKRLTDYLTKVVRDNKNSAE